MSNNVTNKDMFSAITNSFDEIYSSIEPTLHEQYWWYRFLKLFFEKDKN
jgi:hypothetical protein